MTETTYNLASIEGHNMECVFNSVNSSAEIESAKILDTLKLNSNMWRHNNKTYQIIRYDKNFLANDRYDTVGLFRSVIIRDGNIISFSPPKAMEQERFIQTYLPEECIAQEYVEGTMINLFYDKENSEWEIATRSSIGGKMTFYTNGKVNNTDTFRYMFLEACNHVNIDFDSLSKHYIYSFVLQHPNNRIVTPFSEMKIYLVACYQIQGLMIKSMNIEEMKELFRDTNISYPKNYSFSTFHEIKDIYASANTDYKEVGVMIYHKSGVRTKFRNPNYEMVRQLRGNQPKKQYRYLVLRQQGKVGEYLKYYKEDSKEFLNYRNQIHIFTKQLHENYFNCYIKKTKKLKDFPFQYRSHMFTIHQDYLTNLRPKRKHISKDYVINYINTLHPSKLMFSLNYNLRVLKYDEIKADTTQD